MLKVKAARKAPTCYGGGTEEEGHGWEYLCEWEGEQRDTWVWHDKMASVEYARPLANTSTVAMLNPLPPQSSYSTTIPLDLVLHQASSPLVRIRSSPSS